MRTIDEVVEVAAPVRTVWDRWAALEGLPEFMEGIASVRRTDDDTITWRGQHHRILKEGRLAPLDR